MSDLHIEPANRRPAKPCLNQGMRALIRAAVAFVMVLALVSGAGAEPRPGQPAPDVAGETWINSAPLTMTGLRGRVVLVEFWTYG